jgi:glycosyltransferase involved in cell wall biosynthesis
MSKIILLGYSGFPFSKSAASEKQKLIAKAIILNPSIDVEILNYISFSNFKYKRKGLFDGVSYRLMSIYSKYPKNNILRLINLGYGYLNEFLYVTFRHYDYIIISSRNSFYIFGHILISKLRSKTVTLTMVEDYDSLNNSSSRISKIKRKIYFKYVLKYIDGVFPISKLIKEEVIKVNKNLPFLELPIFTNFENFNETIAVDESNYFLFCGAANYFDTIKFIIDSYLVSSLESSLILVINGNKKAISRVSVYLKNINSKNTIILKSSLSYKVLVGYYKNANALLIPLNPDVKDMARFPHKIAEYCASKRPIISSNFGEVKKFFEHKENALLLEEHDIYEMNSLMQYVVQNPEISNKIGLESYQLGYVKFNYKNYGNDIINFLKNI